MTTFTSFFISDYNSIQNGNGHSQSQLHCFFLLKKVKEYPRIISLQNYLDQIQQRILDVDLIQDLLYQHLKKGLLVQDKVMLATRLSRL